MKRFSVLLFALLLACAFSLPVFAQGGEASVVDLGNLLTDSEESALCALLDEISMRQNVDLVAVVIESLSGKSSQAYADDYYEDHGYGVGSDRSGALLLIANGDGEVSISTSGEMIAVISDRALDNLFDAMMDDLYDGNYAGAIRTFARRCDTLITDYREGEPFNIVSHIAISLGIGFVISLIIVTVMKGKLKSVRAQSGAANYIKKDSLNVRECRETFLYHTVNRISRQQNNSSGGGSTTHRSSSGTTHGGGSRSFR